mmetsp:Transcript_25619/g.52440  ORF Transcript_25619/g.52440 Transcript_25619/m.52440 type:complete len:143 (-) Transcript_25619:57-485(-)
MSDAGSTSSTPPCGHCQDPGWVILSPSSNRSGDEAEDRTAAAAQSLHLPPDSSTTHREGGKSFALFALSPPSPETAETEALMLLCVKVRMKWALVVVRGDWKSFADTKNAVDEIEWGGAEAPTPAAAPRRIMCKAAHIAASI